MDALLRLIRHEELFPAFLHPIPDLCLASCRARSCRKILRPSPRERDDETNPGPFDQMKLFSQAIFQCHTPLCLIHEVGVSHWHHLSSSSQATGLSWPLSSSTRETDASEEHLSIRSLWELGCVSIFNQPNETHESDTVDSKACPDACAGMRAYWRWVHACMHAWKTVHTRG